MTSNTSGNGPLTLIRSDEASIWIAVDGDNVWSVEAFLRAPGGLYYLDQSYTKKTPTAEQIVNDTQARGIFSARPCRLGRPIDPSMAHCALAFFDHYCTFWGLDARAILDEVHPKEPSFRDLDLSLFVEQAEWEGIDYPPQWNAGAFSLLLDMLSDTGCDELAEFLEEHPRGISLYDPHS